MLIAHPSVAPHHAELVVTAAGRLHLTDGATAGGTWRRTPSGGWERLRQAFVEPGETIRLGEHVCTPGDLLRAAAADGGRAGRGRLVRDPTTGEIVRRRG